MALGVVITVVSAADRAIELGVTASAAFPPPPCEFVVRELCPLGDCVAITWVDDAVFFSSETESLPVAPWP